MILLLDAHWLGAFSAYDPDVSNCIVSRSLSLVMALKMATAFYLSIECFGHKQVERG